MNNNADLITLWQRTWFWDNRVFMLLTRKKATTKIYFRHYDIGAKTLCTALYLSLHWNVSS